MLRVTCQRGARLSVLLLLTPVLGCSISDEGQMPFGLGGDDAGTCGSIRGEACDGLDNDCDRNVDEGCECASGQTQSCGTSLGECEPGEQICRDGYWGECADAIFPAEEICDGADNDCDGDIDEGCDCRHGTTRFCVSGEGLCEAGEQTCQDGSWGPCEPEHTPDLELCDQIDNDCDGIADEDFNLDVPCLSAGGCPQTRVCSEDGMSSACQVDDDLIEPERCDGIDNDCDGLVDLVAEQGSLRALCACESRTLSAGEVEDASIATGVNLCAATRCQGTPPRLQLDGTCYAVCVSDSDPDNDGWGWENNASCLVEGSSRAMSATPCMSSTVADVMTFGYCLDCRGTDELPFAMCQTAPLFDLTAFGRGDEWIRIEYTYDAVGPAQAPINLWLEASELRKHLPLVRIGDAPGPSTKLLRVEEACFTAEHFGRECEREGEKCEHCGSDEACGAIDACGDYDLRRARLQVAAEFCLPESGEQSGTVTVHKIELVTPSCEE